MTARPPNPLELRFGDAGAIPNNPTLPVLIYKHMIRLNGDPPADVERVFGGNNWPPQWRYGIYPFHHYHSTAHEVLGVARGKALVMLGGKTGEIVDFEPGDVVVLPAGTGHCCLEASEDFLVVGGYPPGQAYDLVRAGEPGKKPAAVERIAKVKLPDSDPVLGKTGPLVRLWARH
jgi:uncharacterized protein YjlB